MLDVISNNHELLFYLALGLMVFGSIIGFVGNSKLTIGEDVNNSKSTIVMRLLVFVILLGGLITYY